MKITLAQSIAAVVGIALLVLAASAGYAYGAATRTCEFAIDGQPVPCAALVAVNHLNAEQLKRANDSINRSNTIMRAMYEDLKATQVAFDAVDNVVHSDREIIAHCEDDDNTNILSEFDENAQHIDAAMTASRAMRSAAQAYANALKDYPARAMTSSGYAPELRGSAIR